MPKQQRRIQEEMLPEKNKENEERGDLVGVARRRLRERQARLAKMNSNQHRFPFCEKREKSMVKEGNGNGRREEKE
jgi:hypothetical protein